MSHVETRGDLCVVVNALDSFQGGLVRFQPAASSVWWSTPLTHFKGGWFDSSQRDYLLNGARARYGFDNAVNGLSRTWASDLHPCVDQGNCGPRPSFLLAFQRAFGQT